MLLGMLGVYVVGIMLLVLTNNGNLFPTIVLIGSFMVPASYVAFFYERRNLSQLSMPTTARGFAYGGILGVLAATVLERILVRGMTVPYAFVVGFIEEFVKILGILVLARSLQRNRELDGLILGAAAGMGFAALESMGYSFMAFLRSNGSLSASVGVTLGRALLSPLGHGTWTAIFAAVLFREAADSRFRVNGKVIGAYLQVVVLHGLWDALGMIIDPNSSMAGFEVLVGQLIVGAASITLLVRRWRESVRALTASEPALVVDQVSPPVA